MCSPSVGRSEFNREQHLEQKEESLGWGKPGCCGRGGGPWKQDRGWNILAPGFPAEKARNPAWGQRKALPPDPRSASPTSRAGDLVPHSCCCTPSTQNPRARQRVQKRVRGGSGCWSEGGGRSQELEASLGSAHGIFQTDFSSGPSLSSSGARHTSALPFFTSVR